MAQVNGKKIDVVGIITIVLGAVIVFILLNYAGAFDHIYHIPF